MRIPKAFICGVAGVRLAEEEKRFLAEHQPYGVILFARNCLDPEQVRALTHEIHDCLSHPYAGILIDQEGGRVARLKPPHWPAFPAAAHFARCYAENSSQAERDTYENARAIAAMLKAHGITINCAPLADVPSAECHDVIGDRAFGDTPAQVAILARAQTNGLHDGGVLSVLKHIPGHGRAVADSHLELPVVKASRNDLERVDFAPFRALSDLPLGMTAHILYTALDAARVATLSPIVIDVIRRDIGFEGLLMSDDISMKALKGTMAQLSQATLDAGCDLVLHCNGVMKEMREIASVVPEMRVVSLLRAERADALLRSKAA